MAITYTFSTPAAMGDHFCARADEMEERWRILYASKRCNLKDLELALREAGTFRFAAAMLRRTTFNGPNPAL